MLIANTFRFSKSTPKKLQPLDLPPTAKGAPPKVRGKTRGDSSPAVQQAVPAVAAKRIKLEDAMKDLKQAPPTLSRPRRMPSARPLSRIKSE